MTIHLESGVLGEVVDGNWRTLSASELAERELELERDQPGLALSTSVWEPCFVFEESWHLVGQLTCHVELINRKSRVRFNNVAPQSADYLVIDNRVLPISEGTRSLLMQIEEIVHNSQTSGLTVADVVVLDRLAAAKSVTVANRSLLDTFLRSCNPSDFRNLLDVDPYTYQKVGIEWLVAHREIGASGALLADVMGLGKTLQAIGLIAYEIEAGRRNNLVLCPGTLTENWRREFSRFASNLVVYLHKGSSRTGLAKRLREHDVVISTYDVLLQDWQLFLEVNWNVVILDEAQAIKNPDAARSRRAKSLSRRFGVAVTGTPLENRILDLWSIAEFSQPEALPTRQTVEDAHQLNFDEQMEIAQSLNDVIRPMMLRRHLEDVDLQLPERVQVDHALEWPSDLVPLYEATRTEALAQFNRSGGLVAVARLRKLTTHPVMVGLAQADPYALSPKFVQMDLILDELLQQGEKAIVFCGYIKMIDYITEWATEKFADCLVLKLDGRTDMSLRQSIIEEFNADSRGGILVTNPTVAGAGLNITGANHVIIYNLEWNPAKEAQAIARIHRNGQVRTCFIHRFYYAGTIEEVIKQRLFDKRELASAGVDGGISASDLRDALEVTPGVSHVA